MAAVSSYVVSRDPNRFGNQQTEYLDQSKKTIEEGTSQVQNAITKNHDLEITFTRLHTFLSKKRQETAIALKTENADFFGLRRNSDEAIRKGAGNSFTLLDSPIYLDCGQKKLASMQNIVRQMMSNAREFKETKRTITENTVFGRKSTFEVEILSIKKINNRQWDDVPVLPEFPKATTFLQNKHLAPFQRIQAFKNAMPELYERHKMSIHLNSLHNTYPNEVKTHFVFATANLEINGKLIPISQFLTWMNVIDAKDPMQLMTEKSKVAIIHLDATLITTVLKDVSGLFKKAIEWKRPEEIRDLKDRVGFLRYEFNNTMSTFRGSEAECEYLENIIYKGIHKLDLKYVDGASVGLDSFRLPLDEFMKVYHASLIVTEPNQQTS